MRCASDSPGQSSCRVDGGQRRPELDRALDQEKVSNQEGEARDGQRWPELDRALGQKTMSKQEEEAREGRSWTAGGKGSGRPKWCAPVVVKGPVAGLQNRLFSFFQL